MRPRRFSFAVVAALAIAACEAQAFPSGDDYLASPPGTPGEIASALRDCENAIRTDALNICAWDSFRRADADFRSAVDVAHQAMAAKPDLRDAMDKANDAFRKFRDATCSFDSANTGGGTMERMIEMDCLGTYTQRRAKALARYAACEKTMDCDLPNFLYPEENSPVDLQAKQQEREK